VILQLAAETTERAALICSVNRALLMEVGPALRAVAARRESGTVRLRFFFDGDISMEDRESANCVAGEVIADFPECDLDERIDRVDAPKPLPSEDGWVTVYMRRERIA
jgi:hypothetical protein